MSLTSELQKAMLEGYERAGREVGYWGNYFLRSVRQKGGLATAKRMLAKAGAAGKTKGFHALLEAGRPDLSVEAVVLSPRFRSLFTPAELATAQARLDEFPAYAHRTPVPPEKVFPETLPDATYTVAAVRKVTVNVYERDPKARAACLLKHGYRCSVSDLLFTERYGSIGKRFIHVHHKKPLALLAPGYRLNPVKDLAPVCPNCHAMLHTSQPPLSIDELRKLLVPAG